MQKQPIIPQQPAIEEGLRDITQQETEWLLQVSYLFIQLEKYDQARCLLEALLEFKPRNFDALLNLGYVHMETGNHEVTLKLCDQLLKMPHKARDKQPIETLKRVALQKFTDKKRNQAEISG